MTGRSVPEWIGKTPDSQPPASVRLRVFNRYKGHCHWSGKKINAALGDKWELDHIKPLHLDGENRESNLAPILVEQHKKKTSNEIKEKAKADRIRAKHLGTKKKKGKPIPGSKRSKWKKKLDGTIERR